MFRRKDRCPFCNGKKVEKYINHGMDEFICHSCGEQWILNTKGVVIGL